MTAVALSDILGFGLGFGGCGFGLEGHDLGHGLGLGREGCGLVNITASSIQAVGGRPPQYAPPRPASSHMIYIIHASGFVDNLMSIWPVSTANQSGLLTLTFDLEIGVRVTCDVRYLCANFGLPGLLCSRLRPDVRDRQTSDRQKSVVRQHHRLMPPLGRGIMMGCLSHRQSADLPVSVGIEIQLILSNTVIKQI